MQNPKIASALTLVLLGTMAQIFRFHAIADTVGAVFVAIGALKLIKTLDGIGRIGAILLLLEIFIGEIIWLSNTLSELSFLFGFWYREPFFHSFVEQHLLLIGLFVSLLSVAVAVCWLSYTPFKALKIGAHLLLLGGIVGAFNWLVADFMPDNYLLSMILFYVVIVLYILGSYVMAIKAHEHSKRSYIKAVLMCGTGLVLPMLFLVDFFFSSALILVAVSIIWLMGLAELRKSIADISTGIYDLLKVYAYVIFLSSICFLLGVFNIGIILLLSAYIVPVVAFFIIDFTMPNSKSRETPRLFFIALLSYIMIGFVLQRFPEMAGAGFMQLGRLPTFILASCLVFLPIFLYAVYYFVRTFQSVGVDIPSCQSTNEK